MQVENRRLKQASKLMAQSVHGSPPLAPFPHSPLSSFLMLSASHACQKMSKVTMLPH